MRWLGIILSAVALVPVTGGCTSSAPGRSARFEPVRFAMGEGPGRITVRGSLLRLLPNYRPVSGVESFLYGPDTGDPPLVRNPQGMTLLGQELLICDQGRSDVVAVDLVTGRARLWSDPNQPPRCPIDITASTDRVFVADTQSDRVIVYTAGGDYLRQLAGPRGAGKPAAVLAHAGVLYVLAEIVVFIVLQANPTDDDDVRIGLGSNIGQEAIVGLPSPCENGNFLGPNQRVENVNHGHAGTDHLLGNQSFDGIDGGARHPDQISHQLRPTINWPTGSGINATKHIRRETHLHRPAEKTNLTVR
jgi:hypothetical protein